jgi:hypothetical protein
MWWVHWQPDRLGQVTAWSFFGLWLGYVLAVDGWVLRRTGTSLLSRDRRRWAGLFLLSAPAWWFFEFLNGFLDNWRYVGIEQYSALRYAALATLCFSTVMPAVFETAELLASLAPLGGLVGRWAVPASPRALAAWIALGLALLGGIAARPSVFFPATWLAVLFVLDPVNELVGWPSVARRVRHGDWRLVVHLGGAALVCGLFWELWNSNADPKWVYDVPHVSGRFAQVFEMPWPGFGGYVPFGLELHAMYVFLSGLTGTLDRRFLGFDRSAASAHY